MERALLEQEGLGGGGEPLARRDLADPTLIKVVSRGDAVLVLASGEARLDIREILRGQGSDGGHIGPFDSDVCAFAIASGRAYL